MTWRRTFGSWAAGACAAAVLLALSAGPAVGADRKDKKQGDQARDAIDKQKDIAAALKDKAKGGGPDTQKSDDAKPDGKADPLQKQLDDLKDKLQKEKDRHAAALDPLNKDLKAQTDANEAKRAAKTQKAIDKENDAFKDKSADLQKRIDALQDRIDARTVK